MLHLREGNISFLLKTIGAVVLTKVANTFLRLGNTRASNLGPHNFIYISRKTTTGNTVKIRCGIYLPTSLAYTESDDRRIHLLPVLVNMHGSGFVMQGLGHDASFCQRMADDVSCLVIDVDYSKGPRAPYPNASVDLDSVQDWIKRKGSYQNDQSRTEFDSLLENSSGGRLKVDESRIALSGFSSGGNLVLTACVRAFESSRLNEIAAVISFYPSTNLSELPDRKPNVRPAKGAAGGVLPPFVRRFLYACYIPQHPSFPPRDSPLVSPLYADPFAFPRNITMITCSGDSLGREGRQFSEKIAFARRKEKNVPNVAELVDAPSGVPDVPRAPIQPLEDIKGLVWWEATGQGHAWDKMYKPDSDAGRLVDQAYALVTQRLKQAFFAAS